jgi:putative NIF3 family GTP cyclohydrolase 1 type 2
MKASDIHAHFVSEGAWVNWSNTTDGFHFGDPEADVTRIAVGWKPYWRTLREAHDMGCDFFLSHESIFRDGGNGDETEAASVYEQEKLVWLRESGMVVYRCHDVWDVFPKIGVRDSWAFGLGFEGTPLKDDGYYRLEDVSGYTFGQLCQRVAEKMQSVRQEGVLAVGDADQPVSRLGLGTGAITKLDAMQALGADVCLLCDDYFRYVRDGALYEDLGVPYMVVNHGAKEEWGIQNLFRHVRDTFPDVPVQFFDQGCPYRIVRA